MSDNGEMREDLKVPDGDIGSQLKSEYDAGKELLVSNGSTNNTYLKMYEYLP